MRTEEERSREADANNRRVKQAAAAAVALLLLRRNKIIAAGVAAGLSLAAISQELEVGTRLAIMEGRQLARKAAVERVKAEADSADVALEAALVAPLAQVARDLIRARLYAERYAKAWHLAATGDDPVAAANSATEARLETAGLTEGAIAFNETRREYVRLSPQLLRMWDSANDKRTCSKCRSADGTVVGANEPFPLGEPGAVHPRCLCTWHIITPEELVYG